MTDARSFTLALDGRDWSECKLLSPRRVPAFPFKGTMVLENDAGTLAQTLLVVEAYNRRYKCRTLRPTYLAGMAGPVNAGVTVLIPRKCIRPYKAEPQFLLRLW